MHGENRFERGSISSRIKGIVCFSIVVFWLTGPLAMTSQGDEKADWIRRQIDDELSGSFDGDKERRIEAINWLMQQKSREQDNTRVLELLDHLERVAGASPQINGRVLCCQAVLLAAEGKLDESVVVVRQIRSSVFQMQAARDAAIQRIRQGDIAGGRALVDAIDRTPPNDRAFAQLVA
ncbi:MAG: hypothetical protein ACR2NP_16935, partial [Pirellulaceae bacterium]